MQRHRLAAVGSICSNLLRIQACFHNDFSIEMCKIEADIFDAFDFPLKSFYKCNQCNSSLWFYTNLLFALVIYIQYLSRVIVIINVYCISRNFVPAAGNVGDTPGLTNL